MPPPAAGVFAVRGVLRRYDWGSTTAIPQLLGEPADGRPAAELWFGAHPDDPSPVPSVEQNLAALIAADPQRLLGADVVDRFGPRLPFLLKVLAADKALSIQVHPTADEARAGFAAEDRAGVERTAPHRNYRDPHAKPELICALTRFEALCGFRPVAQTLALLESLALPELDDLIALLHGPDPLRSAFTALLTTDVASAVAAVTAAAAPDGPLRAAFLCAQDFPGDVGILLGLLLNHVVLEPGDALFLGAGNVHAYLRGTGIEIMGNSDNVLRCGLTPKHVDVDELLRVTEFAELAEPRWPRAADGFRVPVPEFRLVPLTVSEGDDADVPGNGPRLVLCVSGSPRIGDVPLAPGHAAFVAAGERATLCGAGEVFVATVG